MSLIFKGGTDFEQVEWPKFSKSDYGLDIGSIVMRGAGSSLQSYLNSLRQGTAMPNYGSMLLSSWESEHHRTFPYVTLVYRGLIDGALPDTLIYDDSASGTTSATSGDSGAADAQRTWEILFYSPIRRYRYITQSRPTGPRYSTYEGGPVSAASIITQSIRDGNGRARSSAPGISLTYGGQIQNFSISPVPGTSFFEVDEVWQGIIILT